MKKAKTQEPVEQEPVEDVKPITAEEQAIAARVAGDLGDWGDFGEDSVIDYNLGRDIFELPPPAKKKQDAREFAFRWIERTPKRLDQVRNKPVPFRWWICNRTNTPFLDGHFDPVLGCVSREDQMLVFKPWWMRDKEVLYKRYLADSQDQSGNLLGKNGKKSESGTKWLAGKRSEDGDDAMQHEIRGADVVMADEQVMDEKSGIRHSNDTSDLIVDE
jgi:hypothetical protein